MNFGDLVEQYIQPQLIPDAVLYDFITKEKPNLINVSKITDLSKLPISIEVRRRSKQDLFWFARYFTWETNPVGANKPIEENKITNEEYRILCSLFVKKDDSRTILEQDVCKNRLLLWPRGGFKSTIDICDAAQWVLNFPDIRILFLTGVDDLAVGFVDELKSHFVIREEDPSLMNIFFPEYCVQEKDLGNEFEFNCPLWIAKKLKRKEATVSASSIGSTKAGTHFEVIKADDPVCETNTGSSEICKKISDQIFQASNLLVPGGYYFDNIGTRYHDDDHWGVLIEQNVGDMKTTNNPCWTYTENYTTDMRILIGRAIQIKPEVKERLEKENKQVTYKEAGKEGCDLLIPNVMPYSWLMKKFAQNEEIFEGQLNQNPRPASKITFTKAILEKHTIPMNELPFKGPISQTWDFAFSKKKGRDFSTSATAIWNEKGAFYIIDLIRNKFNAFTLAKAVVENAKKYRPFIIGIEDAGGSRLLEPTIISEAQKTGIPEVIAVCSRIDWFTPDQQKDAKKIRMAALYPLIMDDKMWFANYIQNLDVLYKEFELCLTSHHHDDIPDVISQQPRYAPRMAQLIEKKEISTFSRADAAWSMIFETDFNRECQFAEYDETTGRLVSIQPIYNPIQIVPEVKEPDIQADTSAPGLDPILGALPG